MATPENILKYPELYTSAINLINNHVKVCIVMSGLPGSGKSTISNLLMEAANTASVTCKRFFTEYYYASGRCNSYDETNVKLNYYPFRKDTSGLKIIDNLNIVAGQYYKYIQMAKRDGYVCIVMECKDVDLSVLAERNVHGLTYESLQLLSQKTLSLQESAYEIIIPSENITDSESSTLNTLTINNQLLYINCPAKSLSGYTYQPVTITVTGISNTNAGKALIIQQNTIALANNYFVIYINNGYTAEDVTGQIEPSNITTYNTPVVIQGLYCVTW